jgi:protein tyrosine phosphatase (PTP) superfamily phosphohydrolase (DUF442 family)
MVEHSPATRSLLPVCLVWILAWAGCGKSPEPAPRLETTPEPWTGRIPERIDDPRLVNAYRVHPRVISGGEPDREAFQALAELGVRTIISVDGARPDVELAREHGLRYVHLPHGYDGIPERRILELAKGVRDLPGPVFIHCHHGKHRSPAAAATACVAAGLIPSERAEAVLRAAGTSENYRGLYKVALSSRPLNPSVLDDLRIEFPETADVPPLAEAMVALERTWDHVQAVAAAGWKPMEQHPDLSPAHEALLLREHFTELLRSEEASDDPEPFLEMLRESERAARTIEVALNAPGDSKTPHALERLEAPLGVIEHHCSACHRQFRDNPVDNGLLD